MDSFRERYEKFNTSRQEALRLSIALSEIHRTDLPEEWRVQYRAYLTRRIRPAVMELVRRDDSLSLGAFAQAVVLPERLVNDALMAAAQEKKIGALVWLLHYKQSTYGFPDRDYSL